MKPVVLLTNFWDAEFLARKGAIPNTALKLSTDPLNYSVRSIALSHPNLTALPLVSKHFDPDNLNILKRVDLFCPTFPMLMDYKQDKDWVKYTAIYKELLIQRKRAIIGWFDSLEQNKIYILCCWENTKNGVHCHRQLLYSALINSAALKDKAVYLYRHGAKDER